MNRYDAAWPKGRETRRGDTPRERVAAPGTVMDAYYAARYTELTDGHELTVEFEQDTDDQPPGDPAEVQQVIDDETPPDAK